MKSYRGRLLCALGLHDWDPFFHTSWTFDTFACQRGCGRGIRRTYDFLSPGREIVWVEDSADG